MRVRFLKSVSSLAGSYGIGQEADLPPELARPWIKSAIAVEIESPAPALKPHGGK